MELCVEKKKEYKLGEGFGIVENVVGVNVLYRNIVVYEDERW